MKTLCKHFVRIDKKEYFYLSNDFLLTFNSTLLGVSLFRHPLAQEDTMSTQLTISIELIAFMKWVLEHKSEAFAEFIAHALDAQLQKELIHLMKNPKISIPTDELYETLSSFMHHIEKTNNNQLAQDTLHPVVATMAERPKKRRIHKSRCASRSTNDFAQEAQAIESPTQRVLYQLLCKEELHSNPTVH